MIDEALAALRDGKFILLYDFDDREGETDFAIRSDAVTPKHIVQMRKDGGGLICTAVLSHLHDMLWGDRIGPDCKIRLTFTVIEIVKEDELPVTKGCERLIDH